MTTAKHEKEEDVGSVLRRRRTLRGHSLESVHQHTRIPKNLLHALEENDREAFPAPVYMRGFLRNYCDFLELDFEPLWEQVSPGRTPDSAPAEETDERRCETPPQTRFFVPRKAGYIAAAVVAAALASWALLEGNSEAPSTRARTNGATRPAVELELISVKDNYIRLKIDGIPRFAGRFPGDARQRWKASHKVSLRTSSPDALRLIFDGREVLLSEVPVDSNGWRSLNR